MIASALVANVVSNKYIILFQCNCQIYENNYNYNKIRLKNNSMISFMCKNKIILNIVYQQLKCKKKKKINYE